MTTAYFHHADCREHMAGLSHPECGARLEAIDQALAGPAFATLARIEAPLGTPKLAALVHPQSYVEEILAAVPKEGYIALDADTILSPKSGQAALRGLGAITTAVDGVVAGTAKNAFCATRPPGHHAEPDRAMGFCLFNTVAVGAMHARHKHGLKRVAVFDFDVHHGNGTQAAFWEDADALYLSTHQMPLYPGTGARSERGKHANIVNVPLAAGTTGTQFRRAVEEEIIPALDAFAPDILLLSAGFDAHVDDPLAGLCFTSADYAWVTGRMVETAQRLCHGRLVSNLEGGYDLAALGESVAAHVAALMLAE